MEINRKDRFFKRYLKLKLLKRDGFFDKVREGFKRLLRRILLKEREGRYEE